MSKAARRLLASKANKKRELTLEERYAEIAEDIKADRVFEQQRNLINDPSRYKVARCPRRAGKTQTVLHYALVVMLLTRNANVLIVMPRSKQARTIYYYPFLRLCNDLGIEALPMSNQLMVRLENGSIVQFGSADTSDDIEAYRGNGYHLVVIDECDTFAFEMFNTMIRDVFHWALLDKNGTIVCIGTPGYVLQGPFYAIQTGDVEGSGLEEHDWEAWRSRHWDEREVKDARWSLHSWSLKDNVFAPDAWERSLEEKRLAGQADNDPRWLVEGLGVWASYTSDDHVFVYGRTGDKTSWTPVDGLPEGHKWKMLLSVDPGSTADTGFVIGAFAETHPCLYYVYSWKKAGMMIDDQAAKIQELQRDYGPFEAIIIDNAAAEHIKQFQTRFHIAVVPCENKKIQSKSETAELMNADLVAGRIKLDASGFLAAEWRNLVWHDRTRKKYKNNSDDHCSDAAVYLWRYSRHNYKRSLNTESAPEIGSAAFYAAEREKDLKARLAKSGQGDKPLFEQVKQRARSLGTIRDIGRKTRWSHSKNSRN